jgi:hypothetical protein
LEERWKEDCLLRCEGKLEWGSAFLLGEGLLFELPQQELDL